MRLIFPIFLLAFLLAPALAQKQSSSADLGGKKVALLTLPGHCAFNANDPKDAAEIKRLKGSLGSLNLIHVTAGCDRLRLWRKGDQSSYGPFSYTVSISPELDLSGKLAPYVKAVCDETRKISLHKDKSILKNLDAHLKSAIETISTKNLETDTIGIVGEDKTGCYAVQMNKYRDEAKNHRVLASIFSSTLLKGRIANFHRFAEVTIETAPTVVKRLLAETKASVAAHLAANAKK